MWILDGYNLLFRSARLRGSLEQRREALLERLAASFPRRDLIVVFDGRLPPPELTRQHRGRIEIIYTSAGMTADNWIVEKLSRTTHPQRYTVVTEDRGLERLAASCGAKTEDFERWMDELEREEPVPPVVRFARSSHEYLSLFEQRWESYLQHRSFEEDDKR